MEKTALAIDGMSCGHCVGQLRKALAALPGVQVDDVSIGTATVSYEPGAVAPDALARAVHAAGFQLRSQRAANAPAA